MEVFYAKRHSIVQVLFLITEVSWNLGMAKQLPPWYCVGCNYKAKPLKPILDLNFIMQSLEWITWNELKPTQIYRLDIMVTNIFWNI